jgi:outer membrane lipoprotein SlyB
MSVHSDEGSAMKRMWMAVAAVSMVLGIVGCENSAQTGALGGAAAGAGLGAIIDHDNRGRGALIGAGVGALSGYIIGNEMDKAD